MKKPFISVDRYLELPEQQRPQELVWGVVREPPAPKYGHQVTVGRVFVALDAHVRACHLGIVCVSPLDVILDAKRSLVVQPDVVFVAEERRRIIDDQVWGPPDLVVEVASRRTIFRDRTTKLSWYRRSGVRECWIVDTSRRLVVVVNLEQSGRKAFAFFGEDASIKSAVLPDLVLPASGCFEEDL